MVLIKGVRQYLPAPGLNVAAGSGGGYRMTVNGARPRRPSAHRGRAERAKLKQQRGG